MDSMTQMPAIVQNVEIVQFTFKDKCKLLKVLGQHIYS